MNRIYFFATAADILPVLENLEAYFQIMYVEDGLLAGSAPQIWSHAAELRSVGYATADQEIGCASYLIMRSEAKIMVVSKTMTDGEVRFDVYQNNNPDSVLLRLGGFWKDGSLVSGHFIPSSDCETSRKLMNRVLREIKKRFTKIQAFWVGPEALARLRSGHRLCTAIQSPPEYDLHESASSADKK